MEKVRYLALGCFTFELTKERTEAKDWAGFVLDFLTSLDKVEKPSVFVPEGQLSESKHPNEDYFLLPEECRRTFWPELKGASIEFEITIPNETHDQLIPKQYAQRSLNCEKFKVRIIYTFFGPCTFVYCMTDSEQLFPSSYGVILVQEFLNYALKTNPDIKLRIGFPTPFHAEIRMIPAVKSSNAKNSPISVKEMGKKGFTHYEFSYDASRFTSDNQLEFHVQAAVEDEISLFYQLWRKFLSRKDQTEKILREANKLIEKNREKGKRATYRRVFRTSGLARSIGLDALEASMQESFDLEYSKGMIESASTESNNLGVFRSFLDDMVEQDSFEETHKSVMEIVNFVESFRVSEFSTHILAISGIIGAVVGGAIVILL